MRLLLAGLALGLALFANSAQAAVDEKYKDGWQAAFNYIESSFTDGIIVDTAVSMVPKWVPYISQAKRILARAANNMVIRLKPLGIDPSKYAYTEFDGVQIMRVAYALEYAQRARLAAATSGELLAYSLCPWQVPQCTNDVKAAIFAKRGWKA